MSGIARQSKLQGPFAQSESPVILPHAAWAGLCLGLSAGAAVVTVEADISINGDFDTEVEMEGATTELRYPSVAGANILYNAGAVKITWNTGTLTVLQKG